MKQWSVKELPMFRRPARAQRGLSMVEVLVSIVVLSVGLLGVAGLQVAGIRVTQSSQFRAQAAQLATDMADRMRANATAARAGAYNRNLGAAEPGTANAVNYEVTEWLRRLKDLPGGDGAITMPNSNTVSITVQWNDARGNSSDVPSAASVPPPAQPSTFVLVTTLWND